MKNLVGYLLVLSFIISGCKKMDFAHFQNYYFPKCNVSTFWVHWPVNEAGRWDTLFSIRYNESTGYPGFIHCSFRTVAKPAGPYDLKILYNPAYEMHPDLIPALVINDVANNNTVLKVWLNSAHRPDSSQAYDEISQQIYKYYFEYQHNRLSNVSRINESQGGGFIHIYTQLFRITYDNYGNVIRMVANTESNSLYDFKYYYNYAILDKQQFYLEEIQEDLRGFVLMRYLGMFNELQPHNERILVDETDLGYRDYYNNPIVKHQYNVKGQLTQYITQDGLSWNMKWNCSR